VPPVRKSMYLPISHTLIFIYRQMIYNIDVPALVLATRKEAEIFNGRN
jgi:hypothetical protein